MKHIRIEWKHYNKAGHTCDRCMSTGRSLIEAIGTMKVDDHFAGIKVDFKETKLTGKDLTDSNLILLNGIPLETLLINTQIVNTPCKSCCEMVGMGVNCRALVSCGLVIENVPKQLIYQAARKLLEMEVKE